MGLIKDLTTQRFGRLIVIAKNGRKKRAITWECQCDCGRIVTVRGNHLRSGVSKSCGCLNTDLTRVRATTTLLASHTKHGLSRTTEYRSWHAMLWRCYDQRAPSYRYYGGRGISVCAEWRRSFEQFLRDMGSKPSVKHSIDRIDPSGNYDPANCRWATAKEQASNQRHRHRTHANV